MSSAHIKAQWRANSARYKAQHPEYRPRQGRCTVASRFAKKIVKTPFCWFWIGARDRDGYGQMSVNNVQQKAHRMSFLLHRGHIPAGMQVLHRCDEPPCVNPEHLFLGTARDNANDRVSKGRTTAGRWL